MQNFISEYFNSKDFYEIVYNYQKINPELRLDDILKFLTSINVKLMLSLNNVDSEYVFNIFNNKLLKEYANNYSNRDIYDLKKASYRIMIDTIKSYTEDSSIIEQLYNNIAKFDWKFHATNSSFISSIKDNGLSPINDTPQQEIDEMINIFHKYANTAPFTYQKINSEGKISYSRTPDVSYGYGIESPEWFAQFICGSTFYGNIDGVNRQAFRNRDYFSALKNLKLIFDKYKFNDIDQNIIIDFFNKYWKKYGMNTQPELVIVREQNNETKAIFEDIYSDNLNIYDVYMNMHDFNSQSENTIDTSNAIYIKMTKYDKISEYINNKKLQNQNNFSNYFNSEEFYKIINDLNVLYKPNKYNIEEMIGYIVESGIKFYLMLDKEINNDIEILNNYMVDLVNGMNNLDNQDKCNQLDIYYFRDDLNLEHLKKIRNITDEDLKNKDIYNMFSYELYKKLNMPNYIFHAFNKNLLSNIKENGLIPTNPYQNEINYISNIFEKYNKRNPFFMQQKNCVNKVSYSKAPNVSYGYGVDSPEWFANFCASESVASISPYKERNYEKSLYNVKEKIRTFTHEEQEIIINYFNKFWENFGKGKNIPVVSIIPFKSIEERKIKEKFDWRINESKADIKTIMFQSICPLAHPDLQSEEIIDTTNALFIEMPDYNKIVNWYKFNKEEKININCTYETNQSLNEDGIFNLEIINDDINQEKFIKNLNEIIKGYENEIQLIYKDNQLSNIIVNESIALPLIKFLGKNCNATINIDNQVLTGEEADYYNVYSAYIKKIINSLNEEERVAKL